MDFKALFNKRVGFFFLIVLGIILAISPAGSIQQPFLSADEMATKVTSKSNQISAEDVAHILIDKQPGVTIIDIRNKSDYEEYHIPTAINIPLENLFKVGNLDQIDPQNTIIVYSNGDAYAAQAWLLMQQQGIDSFILTGGMNYWASAILNPQKPDDLVADSEILRYQLRQSASQYFSPGGKIQSTQPEETKTETQKPITFKKKKKADEGC
ncbi:MAG: rhodanese-like domain-containing protein [Deferribacteres bacterium]|nr:rhodanese-like domain-containing protein [candidate division KSB1 bacterium]MCB9503810.1 rhodanese-like domain-containing protein [Deferribacteres bacterium]